LQPVKGMELAADAQSGKTPQRGAIGVYQPAPVAAWNPRKPVRNRNNAVVPLNPSDEYW
jgi:hypothetical protein